MITRMLLAVLAATAWLGTPPGEPLLPPAGPAGWLAEPDVPRATPAVPRAAPAAWVWPVGDGTPTVARGFDPPGLPWQPGHRGVDLVTTPGAQVRAAGAGAVTYAGLVAGVGVVTVSHGELRTTYQPVAASVPAGTRVAAGEPIGTVTARGSHCPPAACLHWGLLRGDTYLDPLALVGTPGRARLLPLGTRALWPGAGSNRHGLDQPGPHRPAGPRTPEGGSGPGMGLFVGPPQPVDRHVGVDLRGGQ